MNLKVFAIVAIVLMFEGCSSMNEGKSAAKTGALVSGTIAKDSPVELDTSDAHIIVMRSLDAWSGNNSASEDSLDAVKDHEVGFWLGRPQYKGAVAGFPMLFGWNKDSEADVVVQGVITALKPYNFKLNQNKYFQFTVENPVVLDPNKYESFANRQRELYKFVVITQGNPTTLPGRVSAQKFLGGLLAAGAVVWGGKTFGAVGSAGMIDSGIAGDLSHISTPSRAAITPVELPSFDATNYKSIDVRRVVQGQNDRVGQIIIAYKNEKTADNENEALIKAIVTLTGADTTIDSIKQSRVRDLAKRQAIWDECVAAGKCEKEGAREANNNE
jgi:hypothetical protein